MKTKDLMVGVLVAALLGAVSCHLLRSTESALPAKRGYPQQDWVQYAKPMCGTDQYPGQGGNNNCFPGAVAPFGMIQWSPDTETTNHKSDACPRDKHIIDFSFSIIASALAIYGEDFAMMPIVGAEPTAPPESRTSFAVAFSHDHEIARPGYYAVALDNGVKVELTTTARTGFGRLTYPSNSVAMLMVNAASDINGSDAAEIDINPGRREISGWSFGRFASRAALNRAKRKVYL